ncbi:PIN domain-containing protein, partial [Anoxybacillus flavithermus]|uniref:PIN domain-containing protein n=1 Tax=Anoxybacillus flavithermus TaxID=33934 RepID=UPI001F510FAD
STVNTACCTVNMRFTSLSINIHIMDRKSKKYSAHFMMWLNSYLDTNIFIAAWFEESTECEKILELVKNRKIRLLFAQDTIGELIYLVKNFARYNIDDVSERILLLKWIVELFYYSLSITTVA